MIVVRGGVSQTSRARRLAMRRREMVAQTKRHVGPDDDLPSRRERPTVCERRLPGLGDEVAGCADDGPASVGVPEQQWRGVDDAWVGAELLQREPGDEVEHRGLKVDGGEDEL